VLRLGDRELWARYLLFNEGADLEAHLVRTQTKKPGGAKNGETTPERVEPKGLSQLALTMSAHSEPTS